MNYLEAWGMATAGTLVTLYLLRPVAYQIGLLDVPGGRKCHEGAVPLVGGMAMYLGFVLGLGALVDVPEPWLAVSAAAGLLLVVGVLDDLRELPWWLRIGVQVGAMWMVAQWGGIRLESLGQLLGPWDLGLAGWAVAFTVFAGVGVVNAYNMVDGLDGLAGGIGAVVFAACAILAHQAGRMTDFYVAGIMLAVVFTFFVVNFRVARWWGRVFMGDGGSLFVGLVIACLLIRLSQGPGAPIEPVTALWLFCLPLVDTLSLMVRRVRQGRSPFAADRTHFHHVLQRAGLRDRAIVCIAMVGSVCLAALGFVLQQAGVPQWVRFALFLLLFFGYLSAMMQAWRLEKALRSWLRATARNEVVSRYSSDD